MECEKEEVVEEDLLVSGVGNWITSHRHREHWKEINETQNCFFEKFNKIKKSLSGFWKRKKERE